MNATELGKQAARMTKTAYSPRGSQIIDYSGGYGYPQSAQGYGYQQPSQPQGSGFWQGALTKGVQGLNTVAPYLDALGTVEDVSTIGRRVMGNPVTGFAKRFGMFDWNNIINRGGRIIAGDRWGSRYSDNPADMQNNLSSGAAMAAGGVAPTIWMNAGLEGLDWARNGAPTRQEIDRNIVGHQAVNMGNMQTFGGAAKELGTQMARSFGNVARNPLSTAKAFFQNPTLINPFSAKNDKITSNAKDLLSS